VRKGSSVRVRLRALDFRLLSTNRSLASDRDTWRVFGSALPSQAMSVDSEAHGSESGHPSPTSAEPGRAVTVSQLTAVSMPSPPWQPSMCDPGSAVDRRVLGSYVPSCVVRGKTRAADRGGRHG
jgi:hypothetical protein